MTEKSNKKRQSDNNDRMNDWNSFFKRSESYAGERDFTKTSEITHKDLQKLVDFNGRPKSK